MWGILARQGMKVVTMSGAGGAAQVARLHLPQHDALALDVDRIGQRGCVEILHYCLPYP